MARSRSRTGCSLINHSTFRWYVLAVIWYESELWLRWFNLEPKHIEEPSYLESAQPNKTEFIAGMEALRPLTES
jgi:hypothetical protein